jgi:hypothetical protein
LLYTSSKTSNANTKLFLDSSFHDVGAKLAEMQIFSGKNLPFSVDVGAPKPIANAWHGNNIAIINKTFGRGNIGIPASARGFFINAIVVGYFAATNNKFSVKQCLGKFCRAADSTKINIISICIFNVV